MGIDPELGSDQHPGLHSCAELLGETVVDSEGAPFGALVDLWIDAGTDEMSYAVIELSTPDVRVGELVAVPWTQLSVDFIQDLLVLDEDGRSQEAMRGLDSALVVKPATGSAYTDQSNGDDSEPEPLPPLT